MKDRVFVKPQGHIVDFAFNEDVVAVFPDMIRRSVPGYELIIPMSGLIAWPKITVDSTMENICRVVIIMVNTMGPNVLIV